MIALPSRPSRTEWVPLAKIQRDPRVNTRPVNKAWVDKHVPVFDSSLIGILAVSERPDGTLVVLDGQHRMELLRRIGWGDQTVQCHIYTGLGEQREAAIFRGLNDRRYVEALYDFLAELTAGERAAIEITSAVDNAGWKVGRGRGRDRVISAITSMRRIYGNPDAPNFAALVKTLTTVTQAWGYQDEAVNGQILEGIGRVYIRFGDQVDQADLAKKLASNGSPGKLLGDARGKARMERGTVARSVFSLVVTLYNVRKTTRKLADPK